MKMKELRERLNQRGYDVSERMVKYYIQTGLLPEPEYPHPNQADYKEIHLLRLERICAMKKAKNFAEIKEIIAAETQRTQEIARAKDIDPAEYMLSFEAYAKEEFAHMLTRKDDELYTKEELLDAADCDRVVFEIALDTGVVKDKPQYRFADVVALTAVRNYIGIDATDKGIVEKIGDISKIHGMAAQMINYYVHDKDSFWLYENLFDALIQQKIKENAEQGGQTI